MKKIYGQYLEILDYNEMPEFLKKYLNVPSLVRLKNIYYFCGMNYASKDIYNFREDISRFDHSLNVALITWKLTHDKKATLAGLFHDISTPSFSHVIDFMNKDYEVQESTEEYTEKIMKKDKMLDSYYSSLGIDSSLVYIFVAYDCERLYDQNLGNMEYINYEEFSLEEVWELINNNIINGVGNKLAFYEYLNLYNKDYVKSRIMNR